MADNGGDVSGTRVAVVDYITIGSVSRWPSVLGVQEEKNGRRFSRPHTERVGSRESRGSSDTSDPDAGILQWDIEDIAAWLKEIGFPHYQQVFCDHDIGSGHVLLQLCEDHMKEMGVKLVGHRLELLRQIDKLRNKAGFVSQATFIDTPTLLKQLEVATADKHLRLYPKRIILVRHGEEAGIKLKEFIGSETVTFYVSPFVRSKMTYEQIRRSFHDDQVLYYHEDPRIREQEWGNFQDPSKMDAIMVERRKIGAFYYRFPTGESGADVFDRVSTFLETLYRDMQKGGCGRNTILISHGLFCRLFLTRYYHWTVEKFHKLWNFENCQFAIMELQQDGGYKLISELKSDL